MPSDRARDPWIWPNPVGTESRIADYRTAHTMLPPLATSAGAARRFLRDRLNDWGYPLAMGEVPCLLVSELVTNAIVHTGTNIGLGLRLTGRQLRTVVSDESTRKPVPRGGGAPGGNGFQLVEQLAKAWGVEPTASGKAVWFEVDLADKDRLHWD